VGQARGNGRGRAYRYAAAFLELEAINGWSPTNIKNVADLSLCENGTLWLVKTDGTIWVTTDGGELARRTRNQRRLAASRHGLLLTRRWREVDSNLQYREEGQDFLKLPPSTSPPLPLTREKPTPHEFARTSLCSANHHG
jgi:hypothetical protein